jgi:hypothetical protein
MDSRRYKVEELCPGRVWKAVYDSGLDGTQPEISRLHAFNTAGGMVTLEHGKIVRIMETEFDGGRPARVTEYGVNPPHWSGHPGITPRGPEIYMRKTGPPEDGKQTPVKKF